MFKLGSPLLAAYALLVPDLTLSPTFAAPSQGSPGVLCQNAPYTHVVAGAMTPPKKRDDVPDPFILCAPKSRTYIALTPGFPVDTRHIRPVVVSAYQQILHITTLPGEDHVISFSSGWIFNTTVGAYSLRVKNTGVEDRPLWLYGWTGPLNAVPRHITYDMLGKALLALYTHLNEHGWSQAEFEIWDAGKEFGFGILGPTV